MPRTPKPFRLWNRDGTFYYRLPGQAGWKSTGCTVRTQAENYVAKFLGKTFALPDMHLQDDLTLADFLRPYYTDSCPHVARLRLEKKAIGEHHIRSFRRLLDRYVTPDPIGSLKIRDLRRGHVLDFLGRLEARVGGRTVQRVFSAMRAALREAVYREELTRDPLAGVHAPQYVKRETAVLSVGECQALFRECPGVWRDPQFYTLFLTIYSLGLRKGEALALRWRAIGDREVTVSETLLPDSTTKAPKWSSPLKARTRTVPLPAFTAATLRRYRAGREHVLSDSFVFCDDRGLPLKLWRVWRAFQDGIEAAGFGGRKLHIHSLRHSLMTHLAESDYSAEKARAAFGWTTAAVQAGYTHLDAEALHGQAEIVDRLLQ